MLWMQLFRLCLSSLCEKIHLLAYRYVHRYAHQNNPSVPGAGWQAAFRNGIRRSNKAQHEMEGTVIPLETADATTFLHPFWAFSTLSLKKGSRSRLVIAMIFIESLLNLAKESRSDDTSASPHKSYTSIIQIPAILLLQQRSEEHNPVRKILFLKHIMHLSDHL